MENKNNTKTEDRKTLGLAYITKEILQEGEELPFKRNSPYLPYYDRLPPIDWTKKVGQIYYKLSYSPNYPHLEDSQDLLLMRSADRSDFHEDYLPKIRLGDFGEGIDKLYLSFDAENMSDYDYYRRGRLEGKRLDIISGEQENFFAQIPGSGGMTTSKRFISTAKGALTYQKDIYDNLIEIFIDQNTIPFAAVKRKEVGWVEGNEFIDGYPEFDFDTLEYDGKKWGEPLEDLENGFHFRRFGKISTLSLHKIVLKMHEDKNPCKKCLSEELTKEGYYYEPIRLPGYGNKGIIIGHDGLRIISMDPEGNPKEKPNKVYEVEMKPTEDSVQITNLRELPFSNVTHITPVSSKKVNDTLLEWARNPQSNPYRDLASWICKARQK